jgi:hypothetical protein
VSGDLGRGVGLAFFQEESGMMSSVAVAIPFRWIPGGATNAGAIATVSSRLAMRRAARGDPWRRSKGAEVIFSLA